VVTRIVTTHTLKTGFKKRARNQALRFHRHEDPHHFLLRLLN